MAEREEGSVGRKTMRCADAQEWISESLDGELGAKREAELKAHLEACPDCRSLARDFAEIARQARNLKSPEPSPSVWPRVAAAVRESCQEVPLGVLGKKSGWGVLWNVKRWRFAAAVALVVVGAVVIRQAPWRTAADPAQKNSAEYTLSKLREAQGYYEKAIQSLSEAVQSPDSSLPPQLAEIFERNLEAMDETIQACRQIIEGDPHNLMARAYLLTAYREKVNVLEEMMGLERSVAREKADTAL
jgi:tetratricopeptide (TPR) repeat protein